RLKAQLGELMHQVNLQGGLIARTAAENIPQSKLEEDIYYLLQLWRMVQARREQTPTHRRFELIYQDLSLPLRAIRDLIGEQTERVTV
ncbi:ribonuclease E/G, partial [Mycobacterium tuberculosis]|nr:ribonuclease E/G [Mycobacterium tuberculosis]